MNILTAIDFLLSALTRAVAISDKIKTAQAEGRDISSEELQGLLDSDALAREALAEAIAAAKADGR